MVQLKYFGDDRDYFKYDMITSIFKSKLLERYVFIPMLTDHRNDNEGKKKPKFREGRCRKLYQFIIECKHKSLNHWETWLTPHVASYKTVKPADEAYFKHEKRVRYWNQFKPLIDTDKTLVFVDPDTGLQTGIPSYRKKKGAAKYILDDELKELFDWVNPASILMIYQHLPRDKRKHLCSSRKKLLQVQSVCKTNFTCAYREDDLAFIFVAKSEKMLKQLLFFLNNYHEKSANTRKSIVQLRNEQLYSTTCESGPLGSNAGRRKKGKRILVKRNRDGVVTNAAELTAGEVVNQRVLCPGCHKIIFKKWPLGWDAHVATICAGVKSGGEEERKAYFKQRFAHLFQS
jgi:hypothetical protein